MSLPDVTERLKREKKFLKKLEEQLISEGVARRDVYLIFKNREELKWYWHAKMCKGFGDNVYDLRFILPVIDINSKLIEHHSMCRVESPEVFKEHTTLVHYLEAVRKENHMMLGKELEEFEAWKKTQEKSKES